MELTGKRILFYGPAPTRDKDSLDLGEFDLVIITNNMVNLFFKKHGRTGADVVLFANCFFCRERHGDIRRERDNLSEVWVKSENCRNTVSKRSEIERIRILKPEVEGVKTSCGHALGLTVILEHLKDKGPESIRISGVTYYSESHKRYEEGYEIKEGTPHDIPSEIEYLKNYIEKGFVKLELCPELEEVLDDRE